MGSAEERKNCEEGEFVTWNEVNVEWSSTYPPERELVFVLLSEKDDGSTPASVVIGYCRYWSGGYRFFVTPGVSQERRKVLAWANLPNDFYCPAWPGFPKKEANESKP